MSEVQPSTASPADAPALWNPNAAANWSLLFSPAFGSYVQMLNWRALGEPQKAATSRIWFNVSIGLLVVYAVTGFVFPDNRTADSWLRLIGLVSLLSWYFTSGRPQAKFVKARYGAAYPKRPWSRPLLIAVGALVGYFIAVFVVVFVGGFFIG